MKITLIAPDLSGKSGWSRYAADLGRALAERGHEIHCIVATKTNSLWCTQYPILRPPTSYLGSPLLCALDALRLRKKLKRIKPDAVHFTAESYALMLPSNRTYKTVLTIHGSYAVVPLMMKPSVAHLAERYYHDIDQIIAVSNYTKGYLQKRAPALFEAADLQNRIAVVHNAIELSGIKADLNRAPNQPYRILSVSAIKRKKGYIQSLKAIAHFRKKTGARVQYDIYGSSTGEESFMKELHDMARSLDLTECVSLKGSVSDDVLDVAYKTADLFLLPSLHEGNYFEGFGLVFLEANARGSPVIGGATGGCPEAIKEAVSGYACNPEDIESISQRMEDILVKQTIQRADCRLWAEEHDIRKTVHMIEKLYR